MTEYNNYASNVKTPITQFCQENYNAFPAGKAAVLATTKHTADVASKIFTLKIPYVILARKLAKLVKILIIVLLAKMVLSL